MASLNATARHRLALTGIFLIALLMRLWDLRQPFIGDYAWNEVFYASIASGFFQHGLLYQFDITNGQPVLSTPFVPWLIFLSFNLFGMSEWAARLPMLLCGLACVALLYHFVRITFNIRLALVAAFLAATVPGIVFYSRNVQLDGVMMMFGLGALLTLSLYRRSNQKLWLVAACLLFSLAIFSKYTAVLFMPALTWVWFEPVSGWRSKRRWLGWVVFGLLAVLPSLVWVVFAYTQLIPASVPADAGNSYFLRFNEWSLGDFKNAFLTLWPELLHHLGTGVLMTSLLFGLPVLLKPRPMTAWRPYIVVLLVILPWYVQFTYPRAWVANAYYLYPPLFGFCILAAAVLLKAYDHAIQHYSLTGLRQTLAAGMGIGLILFSNFWDYREWFHGSYYPWPLVQQPENFYSAKQVALLNTQKAPVLTDLTMTLYYTEADLANSGYRWWFSSDEPMIQAISSCNYEFIAFEYPPSINILKAINETGYQQIAHAAWQRTASCSN